MPIIYYVATDQKFQRFLYLVNKLSALSAASGPLLFFPAMLSSLVMMGICSIYHITWHAFTLKTTGNKHCLLIILVSDNNC